ncbi:Crp/Fnr family transcriptional regulator [Sporolactobacillus sp. CQH2019]|uniref:Crp/Fnr family transcriptional regulator n=1 Tax=Sporolactobacillus sp. CQH2019 TaxID=3023512 RepID=UPI002367D93C|nr:Crp/Fnr family transcriptional regulator [Sporolactobacillus sp. CQH2019]MDD9148913.1 Crp/Fnr family transcriptional regulator [Sporolactobacillus sp. CQH2019]
MDKEKARQLLSKFFIFSDYSDEELASIYSSIYLRHYSKGQMLFIEGDPRDRIYFLLSGYVKYERTNTKATLMYTDYVKPYSLFPYGGMLSDINYHYSAIVAADVSLFYIPTSVFETFVVGHSRAMVELIHQLSRILELHEKRLQTITVSSASERVIHALRYLVIDLGKQDGCEITLPFHLSTVDLAGLSGTTRETVSHVLSRLRRDHAVTIQNQKIIIHNPHIFDIGERETVTI